MAESIQEFSNRNSLLHTNSVLISHLQTRLKAKRWRVQEGENIKISYIRALIQALQTQNLLLKDFELDALNKRLEFLENSQAQGGKNGYTPAFEGIE